MKLFRVSRKAYLLTEATIMSEEQTELHGDLQKHEKNGISNYCSLTIFIEGKKE